ncbi:hypothetical protein AC1031_010123 [Aphanomyces cochlioides]|nr:hypothetical protein AC1031_010123 [Aphanomyces cochlioides]
MIHVLLKSEEKALDFDTEFRHERRAILAPLTNLECCLKFLVIKEILFAFGNDDPSDSDASIDMLSEVSYAYQITEEVHVQRIEKD